MIKFLARRHQEKADGENAEATSTDSCFAKTQ